MSEDTARQYLEDECLPRGGFLTEPFDWSITGPAWTVACGISEQRLLDLAIPIAAFRKGTDCWQVITGGKAGTGNVKLAEAIAPDPEAAYIRLAGQLDILSRLATDWRTAPPTCPVSEPTDPIEALRADFSEKRYSVTDLQRCWQEAQAKLRDELAAAVDRLDTWPRVSWFAYDAHVRGIPVNPTEDRVVVDRAAVLRLISGNDRGAQA